MNIDERSGNGAIDLSSLEAQHRIVYDSVASQYEERVEALRGVTESGMKALAAYLPHEGRVLDVGCGVGLGWLWKF